jgi:hypothetical protein
MSGLESGSYQDLRKQIERALTDKDFTNRIFQSVHGITAIVNAIVQTKGENWAAHVVDETGQPLLTPEEQQRFTEAFKDHIDTILSFFGESRIQEGGVTDASDKTTSTPSVGKTETTSSVTKSTPPGNGTDPASSVSETTPATVETDTATESNTTSGSDETFPQQFMNRINHVNQVVNNYATKYGTLKLQNEYDVRGDVPVIPEAAQTAIASGVQGLAHIPNNMTKDFLAKIKIPFRTILFTVYVALDVARISMGFAGHESGRKILSALLALLELLLGDWKKSILTFMGYYGMSPMLYGQLGKVFLIAFRMFDPRLQESFLLGSVDAVKSFIVGILLSIFQITAPEEIRRPLAAALQRVAERKAKINGVLQGEGIPARPDYLSPSFEDLNNIQAVINDKAYVCSCEFQELVEAMDKSSIIRIILQLLRIPVTKESIEKRCGKILCKPFVTSIVETAQEEAKERSRGQAPAVEPEAPVVEPGAPNSVEQEEPAMVPGASNNSVKQKVQPETPSVEQEVNQEAPAMVPGASNNSVKQNQSANATNGTQQQQVAVTGTEAPSAVPQEPSNQTNEIRRGGRILHSRRKRAALP